MGNAEYMGSPTPLPSLRSSQESITSSISCTPREPSSIGTSERVWRKVSSPRPEGPSSQTKILDAMKTIKDRKGPSRTAIYTAIGNAHPGTSIAAVRRAIHKMIDTGLLVHGASKMRFKLTDKGKEAMKPKKKKKKPAKTTVTKKKKKSPKK